MMPGFKVKVHTRPSADTFHSLAREGWTMPYRSYSTRPSTVLADMICSASEAELK